VPSDWFTKEETGFWGCLALSVAAYFKYKTARIEQKENIMENQKLGIKETKEFLDSSNDIIVTAIKVGKDGIDLGKDTQIIVEEMIANAEFRSHLGAAIDGMKQIPAEIKDLDFMEIVELGIFINAEKRTEYQDKVFKLEREYNEEMAKGSNRDDALIYSLRSELLLYCNIYSSELKRSSLANSTPSGGN
jgi:hypothetical protein